MTALSASELTKSEKHGKRLDTSSRSRKINDEVPLTTTGLDLNDLYNKHIAKAEVVRKGKTKALHLLVQFPKELVQDKGPEWKLEQARAYAERVFGPDAVFADRIDVDEKNQDVVDVFVAPLYVKKTKRAERLAFTTTHHLTRLAEKYGRWQTPKGKGQALQDELFDFFQEIGLEGVKRGAEKERPGPDWKSSEQLRAEELGSQMQEARTFADRAVEDLEKEKARRAGMDEREASQDGRQADLDVRDKRNRMLGDRIVEALERERARQDVLAAKEEDLQVRLAGLVEANTLVDEGFRDLEVERAKLVQEKGEQQAAAAKLEQEKRDHAVVSEQLGKARSEIALDRENFTREKASHEAAERQLQTDRTRFEVQVANDEAEIAAKKAAAEKEIETKNAAAAADLVGRQRQLSDSAAQVAAREDKAAKREAELAGRERVIVATELGLKAIEKGEILGAGRTQEGEKGFRFGLIHSLRKQQIHAQVKPAFDRVWGIAEAVDKATRAYVTETKKLKEIVVDFLGFAKTAKQIEGLEAQGLGPAVDEARMIAAKPDPASDWDPNVLKAWKDRGGSGIG